MENEIDLTPWFAADFTRSEAQAYIEAGCTDVQRTLELRMAGITAEQIHAIGLGAAYTDGDTSLADLLSVIQPEGTVDALNW